MPLFLTSTTFAGIGRWLEAHGAGDHVVLVTNASRRMSDGEVVVALADAALADEGVRAVRVDVLEDGAAALTSASAVVIAGGDPFLLLADLRAGGADAALRDANARGVPIVGQSAGAIVLGPSLQPSRLASPFPAPDELGLEGLGITRHAVLPHQDRPGRAARHRDVAVEFGEKAISEKWTLTPLWDDESLLLDGDTWGIARDDQLTRTATPEDAEALARLFHESAREAWAPFLGADRLDQADLDVTGWSRRVAMGGRRFLVTEDDDGLVGCVASRASSSSETETPVGEVDLLYVHPRAWRGGIGRRLLARTTWNLLCEGFREAVLWTETRNDRALEIYRRAGWQADGAVDERHYLGVPIRNVRRRLDLTRRAGDA